MGRRRIFEPRGTGPGGAPTARYPVPPHHPVMWTPAGYEHAIPGSGPGYPGRAAGRRAVRIVAARQHRHRHVLRPWIVMAAVTAAGLAGHATGPGRGMWWLTMLAGLGAGAWQWARRRSRAHRFYAAGCVTAATAWLATVIRFGTASGPGRLAVLALVVPGLWPLSWLWWQYHQVRPGPPVPAPAPGADPVAEAWAVHVGAPGGLYPGTRLSARTVSNGAACYLVAGVRGRHTTRQLTSDEARVKVASALEIDPDRIVLERPLPGPDRNGVNARLIIMDPGHAQFQADMPWRGPTLDKATGMWQAGVYPDTPARCRLYQARNGLPHRALNNAVSGLMGKGKSRFVDLSVAEMLWSGLFVIWYGDGQEGASGPGLRDHVDWYATRRDEVLAMLKAAWKVTRARQRHDQAVHWTDSHGHRRTGRGFWPASGDEPFLQVILDEAQELLRDRRAVRLVKALQRLGPKVGVGVTLVTQEWLVFETGGESGESGAQVIRAFAQTGNVVMFKAGSSTNASALGGALAGIDPRTLPDDPPGLCYLIGHETRPAPVRMFHIDADDLYDWLDRARGIKARLDDLSVQAAGEDYAARGERLPAAPAADPGAAAADLDKELAELLGEDQPGQAGAGPAVDGMTVKQAVLEVVRARGPIKRAGIDSALAEQGRVPSKSAVDQALASWQRTGQLASLGGGMWDAADRDDRAEEDAENRAAVVELRALRNDR